MTPSARIAPKPHAGRLVGGGMNSLLDEARLPVDSSPLTDYGSQESIQIYDHQRKALEVGIYQTPRVEDKSIRRHQRVHDIDISQAVPMPLYDSQLARKWTAPSRSSRDDSSTHDFLVPVRERTAFALRVHNVAPDSMYKYKVFASEVNVAALRPGADGIKGHPHRVAGQDYFVAPTQEWVYGARFADDPTVVRQFQVLGGSSSFSLASLLSKDGSIKFIEIEISSCKGHGIAGTYDPPDSKQQPLESSHWRASLGNPFQHPDAGPFAPDGSSPPRDFSTATSFDVCLMAWTGNPVLITDMNNSNTIRDLKIRIQIQERIPLKRQRIFLAGKKLEDDYRLKLHCTSGITTDLFFLSMDLTPEIVERDASVPPGLPEIEKPNLLQQMMKIGPGGLVKQEYIRDEYPERWNEHCEGRVRIHLIDERHFEKETGLKLEANSKPTDQSAFAMFDPSAPFIMDHERSNGIPSIAELSADNRAVATLINSMDPEQRAEEQVNGEIRARRVIKKITQHLFRYHS